MKEGRKADGNHQKKGMQEERFKEREIEEREREIERERSIKMENIEKVARKKDRHAEITTRRK